MELGMTQTSSKKNNTLRVVIADDHYLFQQILQLTLEQEGMEVVQVASTGRQAVDAVIKHKPDLVLLDILMPEMDGLAALSILKYMVPDIPIIIVSAVDDPLYIARAGELGASGYFSKGVKSEELISAIHSIASGEESEIFEKVAEPKPPSLPGFAFPKEETQTPLGNELTEQESIILSLIAMGLDNQAIMDKLHISKNTLKTHTRNIFSKLGVSDRTQAAIWALQNGYGVLVSPQ
jgi:DNA-binding NarL/FixJ family response regulator